MTLQVALDVGRLIAVAAQAPDKHAETVEIVALVRAAGRGPEPDRLLRLFILYVADRKVSHDAPAFGVLRHLVGNRHIEAAGQHPPGLPARGAHQAPSIRGYRLGLRLFRRSFFLQVRL